MAELTLTRFSYSGGETEGILTIENLILATIEKPWRNNIPFDSCVPEGEYTLEPFTRPNGDEVYRFYNPELDVYQDEDDLAKLSENERYLCLIHSGNFERHVVGCIAPGLERGVLFDAKENKQSLAVTNSRNAMSSLKEILGNQEHTLIIEQVEGAVL
jgi:hypothetical protein